MNNYKFIIILIVFSINFYSISAITKETLTINSPNYFNEQTKIFDDIHYIEEEHLSFEFCSENEVTNKKVQISCETDKKELELFKDKRNKNCFYSNYELIYSPCKDFTLEVSYESENKQKKITRNFKKIKQSKLLNLILGLDYLTLSPIDLSYYLIVLNEIIPLSSKKSINAYETLKNLRNNANKCWVTASCSIKTTSKILRNIKLGGYSLNTRLLEDGKTFLEKMMISNSNNPLKIVIQVDKPFALADKLSCTLTIDNDLPRNYLLNQNLTVIQKYAANNVGFSCNETVNSISFLLTNTNNKTQDFQIYNYVKSFNYKIAPFACIGESTACDFKSTINTLTAYETTFKNNNLLNNYLDTIIVSDPIGSYIDSGANKFEDMGQVLYYTKKNGMLEYLKFNQNNDGSWGSGDQKEKIKKSAWAILGLQKSGASDEYISDGKKWIYYNEPIGGWGDTEKNTLAYLAIKETIKPYLKISTFNVIKDNKKLTISNPTIYNIKNVELKFSKEINKYLSYTQNIGDINSEKKSDVTIKLADDFYGQLTGDMIISGLDEKNNEIEFIKIPVTINGPLPFKLISGNYSVEEELKTIHISISKQINTYKAECEYTNPFDNTLKKITIDDSYSILDINNPTLKSGTFDIEFKCSYDTNEFLLPLKITVNIAKKTFEVEENEIILTDTNDFAIKLTSTYNDKQTITTKIEGQYEGVIESAETSKIVASLDEREIFFTIKNPLYLEALGNTSKGNIIIKSNTGYLKIIPVKLRIGETLPSENPNLKWYISIGILLMIILGVISYRKYQIDNENNNYDENSDEEYYME